MKKDKLPDLLEAQIQKQCIFLFRANRWLCHRMSQVPSVNKKGQKYFPKTETPGVADYLCCAYGRFVAVEFKRPGLKQTQTQHLYEKQVQRSGGIYVVIHGIEEAEKLVAHMKKLALS